MTTDGKAIRELVNAWMKASQSGDIATMLNLMTDDAVFLVPGREPFGKQKFVAGSKAMAGMKMEGASNIVEIQVLGDWAWMRNKISLTMTPPGGQPMVRSGYTLTILKKNEEGRWQIARDANLLVAKNA